MIEPVYSPGLEGVIAGQTAISVIKDEDGADLHYRGYPIAELVQHAKYHALGLEPRLNTAIFAMARVPAWSAHFLEQRANNRLFAPRSTYVGSAMRHMPGVNHHHS
jgi:citrate synthase